MIAKSQRLIISTMLALIAGGVTARAERLELHLFKTAIVSNYNLVVSSASKIDDWQAIDIKFSLDKSLDGELYFPARYIAKNVVGSAPNRGGFEIDTIHVALGRHTSYFRLVYGVRITLKPVEQPGRASQKPLYGMASFVGERAPGFLATEKAKQAISAAIVECLSRLQPEN